MFFEHAHEAADARGIYINIAATDARPGAQQYDHADNFKFS